MTYPPAAVTIDTRIGEYDQMAKGTSVGDLGPYHFVCLFFGYHSGPRLVKWRVAHSLCIVLLLICCIYLTEPQALTQDVCVEYMLYILISMVLRDRHLHQFYQQIPAIDWLPHAKQVYTNIRKHQIIAFSVWIAYRSVSTVIGIGQSAVTFQLCSKANFDRVLMVFIYLGVDVNQMSTVLIVYLLYIRVVIVRRTIQTNGFEQNPIMAYSPRKYIQMYELLLNSLYKNQLILKVMTVIFLCTTTYRLQQLIFVVISFLKVANFVFLPLFMIFRLTMPYVPFICTVVLLDLVRDELARINMLTIQTCIECKNERCRWELMQLRQVLESRPLSYSLWRIVSLSLYPVLTTLSFWIVTSMGIVQISFH